MREGVVACPRLVVRTKDIIQELRLLLGCPLCCWSRVSGSVSAMETQVSSLLFKPAQYKAAEWQQSERSKQLTWLRSVGSLGSHDLLKSSSLTLALACFLPSCFLTQSIERSLLFSGNSSAAEWIFSSGVFHVYDTVPPWLGFPHERDVLRAPFLLTELSRWLCSLSSLFRQVKNISLSLNAFCKRRLLGY